MIGGNIIFNKITSIITIIMLFFLIYLGVQKDVISLFSDDRSCHHLPPSQMKKTDSVPGYAHVSIDPTRVQLLGLSTEKVVLRDLTKKIRTVGIVAVDETRIAHVQTKFNGWIEKLYVDFIGMPVKKGQPLFTVYSPELLSTQAEYLIALRAVNRKINGQFSKELAKLNTDLLRATRQRLLLWDISSEQIKRLDKDRIPTKTLIFRSPIDGIVLDKTAFIGMNVAAGMNAYTIADLSHVWLLADIYENDTADIMLGQRAEFETRSLPSQVFHGSVTFADYVVEASTRTVKVRFEFDNSDYHLKPGMFGTINIELSMGKTIALPEEALIATGMRVIVFVEKEKGRYEPREVSLGFKAGPYYQVLEGVAAGEMVVVSSQFLLDSESRLKAFETRMKGIGVE